MSCRHFECRTNRLLYKASSLTCINTSTDAFGCIPPIYFKYCHRIKEQLVIHWDTTLKRFRTQLIQFISNNIKDTQEKEVMTRYTYQFLPQYTAWFFCILCFSYFKDLKDYIFICVLCFQLSRISSGQKAELMRLMNEAVQLLRPLSVEDPDFKIMMANVTNFRKIISQVKSGAHINSFHV